MSPSSSAPRDGAPVGASRQALEAVVALLQAVASPAVVTLTHEDAEPAVAVTPLSLVRVGRSRREGALLDLQLTLAVAARGPDALSVVERLLVAAETSPHIAVGPLPSDRPGLGFTLTVGVSVPISEPTGPQVLTPVVDVRVVDAIPQLRLDLPSPAEGS